MESPQMYDSPQTLSQIEIKKAAVVMAQNNVLNNNNNENSCTNNNNTTAINNNNNNNGTNGTGLNHNPMAVKQANAHHMQQQQVQQQQQQQQQNVNNNSILQKHIMQQYAQSDLEELTSQEISLDLQHLINDQFGDQEALGIFTDMVPSINNNNTTLNNNNNTSTTGLSAAAKVLQLQQTRLSAGQTPQQQQQQQSQGYARQTLAYMPQPVHTGATYSNHSSDDNSSVGSDAASTIKEEPIDPQEYRRQLSQMNGAQFIGTVNQSSGIYPIPPNYASNGSGNTFTTLQTPGVLGHHQALPHLGGGAGHIGSSGMKHKQIMSHRKSSSKSVDKGTDEYRRRRERNNIAVRKSREKAKVRSREVEEKVKTLIKEKDSLIRRLDEMTNEIQLHKQLYVHLMNHNNPEVNNICRSVLSLVSGNDHGM